MTKWMYIGRKADLNNRSGVYEISCSINKKTYIGSAVNLYQRLSKHKTMLKQGSHDNIHLQRAFNKYGIESFSVHILEFCDRTHTLQLEQKYINKFKPRFNINTVTTGGYPGKQITLKHLPTGVVKTWNSRREAAIEIGCNKSGLSTISKGRFNSIKC